MEYQKIIKLLDNTPNQPTKFRAKNWVKINDDSRQSHNTNSPIKCKSLMLRSSLCDYSDAYILFKGTISIAKQTEANPNNGNKELVFKNCAHFTDCVSEINNTQINTAENIDVVIPIYNLIKYSDNYSKTSGRLWQYYGDERVLTDAGAIANFHAANNSALFKSKQKIPGKTSDGYTKDVEIMVLLKYLRRTLEMPLINCEINLILTWSEKCVLSDDTKATTFAITDAKLYVPIVTL